MGGAYFLRSFEARDTVQDPLRQCARLRATVLCLELFRQYFQLVDGTCDAPPCALEAGGVALAIDSKCGVVIAFDEKISSLVAVAAPWLDTEADVEIFVMAGFVLLVDHRLDGIG